MERSKPIIVTSDASGAQAAAREGFLVMIVDVIDMSTTLESALEAGAVAVWVPAPMKTGLRFRWIRKIWVSMLAG